LSAQTDLRVEILFVPILLFLKSPVPVYNSIPFGTSNVLGCFPYDVSDNADEHVTFSRREKTSVRLGKSSTGHKREGTAEGSAGVWISVHSVCTETAKGGERKRKGRSVSEQCVVVVMMIVNNSKTLLRYSFEIVNWASRTAKTRPENETTN
jgi:hypothetical protein